MMQESHSEQRSHRGKQKPSRAQALDLVMQYRQGNSGLKAIMRKWAHEEVDKLTLPDPGKRNAWKKKARNEFTIECYADLLEQFDVIDTSETLKLLTANDEALTTPLIKKVRAAFKESLRALHIEVINGSLMDTRDNQQRQASPYTELTDKLTLAHHFERLAKKINEINSIPEGLDQQKDELLKQSITNFAKEFPSDMSPAARTCIGLLLGAVLGAAAALAVVALITSVDPGIIDFTETITAIAGGAGAGGVFAGSAGFFGKRISQQGADVLENFTSSIAPDESPQAADNADASAHSAAAAVSALSA